MGKKSNSQLLAGLCYVPFLFVNLIFIIYVLITQKKDRYARYHALQSLCLNAAYLAAGLVAMVLFFSFFMSSMTAFSSPDVNSAAPAQAFGTFFSLFILVWLCSFAVLVLFLVMAVLVGLGKDIRIPLLRGFVERYV